MVSSIVIFNNIIKNFIAKISSEDLKILQNSDQDPEVRPGLFEGDIAMSNEVRIFKNLNYRKFII